MEALENAFAQDPTNLAVANRYWEGLGSVLGHYDVRSGQYVIKAYRNCALISGEGVLALAVAYRELNEMSGEGPRAKFFDEELIESMRSRLPELPHGDRSVVQWVLDSIQTS
jgi:hypothetical protein